jgi:hypothetical protein
MAKISSWNFFINPIVQVVTILIVSFLLYFMSAHYLGEARIFDLKPVITNNLNTDHKIKIKTGLFINNFLDVNLVKSKLQIMGIVWFEFPKGQVDLNQLEEAVFSKADLKPQSNLHDNLCGSATPIIQEKNGMILAQYPVKIDFMTNLNHKLFPFDSHRVYLTLNNMHLDSNKYYFEVDSHSLVVSQNTLVYGWQNISKQAVAGFANKQIANDKAATYPRVIYSLDFVRTSFKDILLLLLPLLVLFFMSMFSFSYDHSVDRENILEIGVASVAAMVAYRFVIDTVAPNVPYFMLIDWLFALFLVLSFLVFLINVFDLFKNQRGLVVLLLHMLLVISWYGLLFIWG